MCADNKKCRACSLAGILNSKSKKSNNMKLNFKKVGSAVMNGLGGTAVTVGSDYLLEAVYPEAPAELKAASPAVVAIAVAAVAPGIYKKAEGFFDASIHIGAYRTAQALLPSIVKPAADTAVSGMWNSMAGFNNLFRNGNAAKPAATA